MSAAAYRQALSSIAAEQADGEDTSERVAALSRVTGIDIGTIEFEVSEAANDQ
ncbi:hypothetical protein [Croceicoccus marinus]|jgi:hypothetical protein|uniref:Uncharacterized protein n=1 Tax=Croceicoccus marinus TaxID=450378 RepID=A0A7G6VZU8_9SPHN|nr:hypothetical protein [Croceicoccus marinus]QNE07263.1 hypothetical protein H4O24_15210 [Croceicoccus marinus]